MIKKGKGVCCTIHSSGLTGGSDPSEVIVRINMDGTANVHTGATEMGQGLKTVVRQLAAETLHIEPEDVCVVNADTNATPFDTGQFASRTTLVTGRAVVKACNDLINNLKIYFCAKFSVEIIDIDFQEGVFFSGRDETKRANIQELAAEATWAAEDALSGVGRYVPKFDPRDDETGKADLFMALQFMSCIAEIEVDTVTGEVTVVDLVSALEMGNPINPMLLEGQIHGGVSMGLGNAMTENILPQYPGLKHMRTSFRDYIIPSALDMPKHIGAHLLKNPTPHGPYGAKGCGEIVANVAGPAIANAIMNAIGVKFYEFPITPEKILRALEEK